ncbi:hypothetical protein HDU84_000258 [Entophlyctis sp. JEL0112]|nr:hypothetical protein HDU84_000258 [Entophlyctis sp. JEL0112]
MRGWLTRDIAPHKFDDNEFATWCNNFKLKSGEKVDPQSDEAIDALYWTGGVPYELSLLWDQPAASVVNKTREYRSNRVGEMADSHGKFCCKLVSEEMLILKECVARMALGLTRPAISVGMDRELFDIIRQPKEGHPNEVDELIVALNPVARLALIGYHGQGFLTSLGLVTELVLKRDYTQDVKGRITEKYLLTTMEVVKKFSFKHTTKIVGGLSTGTPTCESIELVEIVPFSGQKLPPSSSFNRKHSTLFIPESVIYPGYDFFIWNSESSELLAFQVTMANPFYEHPKIDSASARENCNSWSVFCNANAVKVYWVIPKSCVGGPKSKKAVGNNVILFESLWSDYPSLEHLKIL